MPLGFFMSEVFDLGIQVSPLKLTDSEIALFNAILIMNPGKGVFSFYLKWNFFVFFNFFLK